MKTYILKLIALLLMTSAGMASATGQQKRDINAQEIVEKANMIALYQGCDCQGKVVLNITDKNGRSRKRVINILRKNSDKEGLGQMYYAFFRQPADVRKMVFMVHKHGTVDKDDDRWLYMPGLDLVKRIAAGDKRTSFAGSDFLYEDISGRHPLEDTHELVKVSNEFYILRNVPKKPKDVDFEYYTAYVNKKTFVTMRLEYFKTNNRLSRTIEVMKVKNIEVELEGKKAFYPTVIRSVAKNYESGSRTEMVFSPVNYNIGVKKSVFTERYLRRPPVQVMRLK